METKIENILFDNNLKVELTESEVVDVIKSGIKMSELAQATNMSQSKITAILARRGINYQHLRQQLKKREIQKMAENETFSFAEKDDVKLTEISPLQKALLADVIRVAKYTHRCPDKRDIQEFGFFNAIDLRKIGGGLTHIRKLLKMEANGFSPYDFFMPSVEIKTIVESYHKQINQPKINKDEKRQIGQQLKKEKKREVLIEELKLIASKLGRAPKKIDLERLRVYMTYYRAFGSLLVALKIAGIENTHETKRKKLECKKETDERNRKEMLDNVWKIYRTLGRVPLPDEICPGTPYEKTNYYQTLGSYPSLCKKAGFKVPFKENGKYYSNEYLFEIIRKVADIIGHAPSIDEFNKLAPFSYMVLVRRFGKFSEGIKLSGLQPVNLKGHFNKKVLLEMLKNFYSVEKRAPDINDCKAHNLPYAAYVTQFGTFKEALHLAGIPGFENVVRYKDRLVQMLQKFATENNRAPRVKDLKKPLPGYNVFKRHFGSFNIALAEAGLVLNSPALTREQLSEKLQSLSQEDKNNLKVATLQKLGLPTIQTFKKHYGKFSIALKENNIERKPLTEKVTRGQVIESIRIFYNNNKHSPSTTDFGKNNMPALSALYSFFKTLPMACEQAGILYKKTYNAWLSNETLVKALKDFAIKFNRNPVSKDFGKNNLPAFATYYKRFGGLKSILKMAGL